MSGDDKDNLAGLSERVRSVEGGLRDLKGDLIGLEKRLDAGVTRLGEMITARGQPNWIALISSAGLMLSALTTIGYLALSEPRDGVAANSAAINEMRRERYQEQRDELARLQQDLRAARRRAAGDPPSVAAR